MPLIAHLDYETRSRVELKDSGAYRYAIDSTTEIFMAGVSSNDTDRVALWINPKFQSPKEPGDNVEAEELLSKADLIYVHGSPFEPAITWGADCKQAATPFKKAPPLGIWRCTMALARRAGLPQSLAALSEALGLAQKKDTRGAALIRFFCSPRADGNFNEPEDFPEKWKEFCSYCRQDVRAEKEVERILRPFQLRDAALETFLFDLRMNQAGIPVNVTALNHSQIIIDEVQESVTRQFRELTGLNPTQRTKTLAALKSLQVEIPDMKAATLDALDTSEANLSPEASKVLGLYRKVSYAAVKKVQSMRNWVCPDGRMRGVLKYYGAGTGRWSAGGPQIQNAKKATPEMRPITDAAYAALQKGIDAEDLDQIYGEPLEVISCCVRNFVHVPGKKLLNGDYNAIEARIICWLAGQTNVLEMMRQGADMYKFMAKHIYAIPEDEVDFDQREVGKRVFLGAGFQMGANKFKRSCQEQYQLELPLELCERGIETYRNLCDKVVSYWHTLQAQCLLVVKQPLCTAGPFSIRKVGGIIFLLFKLRSGRSLAYPHPKIEWETVAGDDGKPWTREQITYWGQLPLSSKWGRVKLYGGKLAENETQATAADIMANGALVAEKRGMPPFALIHDQGLAIQAEDRTPEDFSAALGDLPSWAGGLPLRVETKSVPYYSK